MMILDELNKRKLPNLLFFEDGSLVKTKDQWKNRRKEIIDILCCEEYGRFPIICQKVTGVIIEEDTNYCAGKAIYQKVALSVHFENGSFSFPIYITVPKNKQPCPTFLHINFRDLVPDEYMPTEEICDNGFAVVSFGYKDITPDDNANNLYDILNDYIKSNNSAVMPGKIAIRTWAVMRVMDYMQTLNDIDKNNIAIVGHSRLGKTALLAGAFDERFAFSISNNSGCGGAAISRGKSGETIKDICDKFPNWFCDNYKKYAGRENDLPFDQHFLLATIAPRKVYVASAVEDAWADPRSEFLSCIAASKVYEFLGEKGFIYPDRFPNTNESLHDGNIGYHIREGTHALSRYDWQRFIEYIKIHINK